MMRRPPRSTLDRSSAASDVYKRQVEEAPADTTVTSQVWYADDVATGLVEAADTYDADVIVIGGGRHGTLGRVALGSIGNILLHLSLIHI